MTCAGRSLPVRAAFAAVVLVASALCGPAAHAEMAATPLRGDSRLVEFEYDQDNTYLVLAKPKAVTHILFAPDEVIQSVAAGDTNGWEFTPTKNRKNLFVKPRYDDQETSLTVITDKRNYQFVLRSTGEGKKWYQRISWLYATEAVLGMEGLAEGTAPIGAAPANALAPGVATNASSIQRALSIADAGVDPQALRFDYEVSGDAPFRPGVVFDDGRFTYFKMPAMLQEMPVLLAVADGKQYSLVNFEVKGEYLVAQRLLPRAVLKLGREEVHVSRKVPKRFFFAATQDAP